VGFDFSQSSLSSGDGIAVEKGMSMGEGEGGKVKRVGMSRYWDATQSQGEGEGEGEDESEGEGEVDERYCVISGECLGHPKCYQKGTRFDGYCFIEARADAMGDCGEYWSDGSSDWALDGDDRAWRAKGYRIKGDSEGEEEPLCVRLGECLGHPKCYKEGTRFDDCCFIEARCDAMAECGGYWSDGSSEWGLDGDDRAWCAKGYRKNPYSKNNGRRPSGRFRRGGKPRWKKRKLCRESEGEEGIPSGPVLVSDWAVGEDHERLQSVFGWSF